MRKGERAALVEMTRACGIFRPDEIEVADELLQEAERHGAGGQYQVLVAEQAGKTVGWACYGLAPMTDATFDLYWIVVAPAEQNRGIGRQLLDEVEQRVRAAGGRWILADTSSTAAYEPTRAFYRRPRLSNAQRNRRLLSNRGWKNHDRQTTGSAVIDASSARWSWPAGRRWITYPHIF